MRPVFTQPVFENATHREASWRDNHKSFSLFFSHEKWISCKITKNLRWFISFAFCVKILDERVRTDNYNCLIISCAAEQDVISPLFLSGIWISVYNTKQINWTSLCMLYRTRFCPCCVHILLFIHRTGTCLVKSFQDYNNRLSLSIPFYSCIVI